MNYGVEVVGGRRETGAAWGKTSLAYPTGASKGDLELEEAELNSLPSFNGLFRLLLD